MASAVGPQADSTRVSEPAWSFPGKPHPPRAPAVPGVGTYEAPSSLGKQVTSMAATSPILSFGAKTNVPQDSLRYAGAAADAACAGASSGGTHVVHCRTAGTGACGLGNVVSLRPCALPWVARVKGSRCGCSGGSRLGVAVVSPHARFAAASHQCSRPRHVRVTRRLRQAA